MVKLSLLATWETTLIDFPNWNYVATCPGSTWSDLLVIPIVAAITSGFVVQAIGQEAAL